MKSSRPLVLAGLVSGAVALAYWWSQDASESVIERSQADASSGLTLAERQKLREQLSHQPYRTPFGVSGMQIEVSAGELPARSSRP